MTEDGPTWYACMTGPRQEALADANLRQQGYFTFYPFERIRRRRKIPNRQAFRVEWVEMPYFPRYLFVAIRHEHESLYGVNETDGVSTVVYAGDTPLPVPHAVMDELMSRADVKGVVREIDTLARKRYIKGEMVRFVDESPFAGFIATISVDSGAAVRVFIETLGRKREINVPPGLLERAVNS